MESESTSSLKHNPQLSYCLCYQSLLGVHTDIIKFYFLLLICPVLLWLLEQRSKEGREKKNSSSVFQKSIVLIPCNRQLTSYCNLFISYFLCLTTLKHESKFDPARVFGFPSGFSGKGSSNARHTAGEAGLIAGSGRSPGEGDGNPLQCSCLGNPMDRGAWWVTVHGVTKNRTRLGPSACCGFLYKIYTSFIFPHLYFIGQRRNLGFSC